MCKMAIDNLRYILKKFENCVLLVCIVIWTSLNMFLLVRICLMKIVMLFFIGFPNNLFNNFIKKNKYKNF